MTLGKMLFEAKRYFLMPYALSLVQNHYIISTSISLVLLTYSLSVNLYKTTSFLNLNSDIHFIESLHCILFKIFIPCFERVYRYNEENGTGLQ